MWGSLAKGAIIFGLCLHSLGATALNIDSSKISVSGISSGAYMAGQLAVAHSDIFMGLGLVAGGPYYCAKSSLNRALTLCMDFLRPRVDVGDLISSARNFESQNRIDPLSNLKRTRFYAFSGTNDQVVPRDLVAANFEFFKGVGVDESQFQFDDRVPAGHAFPTVDYGNACSEPRSAPFISSCSFDGAGRILSQIYGELKNKVAAKSENFSEITQKTQSVRTPMDLSLADTAIVYVPSNCRNGAKCKLHVALHGCRQTRDDIGDQFYKHSGFAEWAEDNNIILLFPQTVRNKEVGNPLGCWDWWGYTSPEYSIKSGPQIKAVYELVQALSKI